MIGVSAVIKEIAEIKLGHPATGEPSVNTNSTGALTLDVLVTITEGKK
jgi:hypothetical protein